MMETKDVMVAFGYDSMVIRTNAPEREIENLMRKFCDAYEDGRSCYDEIDKLREQWDFEVLYDSENDSSHAVPHYDVAYNVADYFEEE